MNELPNTAIGTLRLFAATQVQVDVMSDQLIASVKQGEVNPLEVLTMFRAIEKVSDRVLKEIKENLLNEASKYSGNSFEYLGNKVEKAELGTKYDFSKCNDPAWENFDSAANAALTFKKEREIFLKGIKDKETIIDPNTGEVVTILPPVKTSTAGLKVTIK
jgi:hypothetical protein